MNRSNVGGVGLYLVLVLVYGSSSSNNSNSSSSRQVKVPTGAPSGVHSKLVEAETGTNGRSPRANQIFAYNLNGESAEESRRDQEFLSDNFKGGASLKMPRSLPNEVIESANTKDQTKIPLHCI
ncbi:hypothetical protein M0802_001706 [Mischocyttarus mexicanus]|nr:hypothetical protein M0802_001706 [Mischocyttarus mexicanus]